MLLPFILLSLQAAGGATTEPPRYAACMDLASADPAAGVLNASRWRIDGGGMLARQCLGVAYANQQKWDAAAAAFEEAAQDAGAAKDARAANYWAQAGNAWLAAGDAAKARRALDAALSGGSLAGLPLGEAHLDRARALVGAGDLEGAREDIDTALGEAKDDPLAWLLSATLARRQGDLPRAHRDIAEALKRAGNDASVQLEAGNIAAAERDETGARSAWARAVELGQDGPVAAAARKALEQFNTN